MDRNDGEQLKYLFSKFTMHIKFDTRLSLTVRLIDNLMYIRLIRKIEQKDLKTCYLIVKQVPSISQVRCNFSRKRRHIMPCEVILLLYKKVLLSKRFHRYWTNFDIQCEVSTCIRIMKKDGFKIFWKGSFDVCSWQDDSISNPLQDIGLKW